MKLVYYPGCTLKTKALNLENSALAALKALGVALEEMPRWNCCGAVFSLADDDLIHHVAPVRNLIRAQEGGADTLVTLCSQCYNTLARANELMRSDREKRDTINRFMDEEPDYAVGVEVLHYLAFLRDQIGWDALRDKVKVSLDGLKVAPFYGCSLLRPQSAAISGPTEAIFNDFLGALGAEPVALSASAECCGSYQGLANPDAKNTRVAAILDAVNRAGADAIVVSCPMCEYNLGTTQGEALARATAAAAVPTYYFTQLLAVALAIEPELCRFDLNAGAALKFLEERSYIAPTPV